MAGKKRASQKTVPTEVLKPDEVVDTDGAVVRIDANGDVHEFPVEGPEPDEHGQVTVSGSEVRRHALALRLSGMSYPRIAETLNISVTHAHRIVKESLDKAAEMTADELRRVLGARLEHMLMLLWPDVNRRDLPSMAMTLSIIDRIERMYGVTVKAAEEPVGAHIDNAVIVVGTSKEDFIGGLRKAREAIEKGG